MSQQCPQCQRVLDFGGQPLAFCAFCGSSLTATVSLPPDAQATLAPHQAPAEEMPERLGEYRLLRLLGRGGMGSVFLGEHSDTGQRVAVKLIDAEANEDALVRFQQEGKLASALVHPRCVFVLAAKEDQGRPYIVLELMPGNTLEDVVKERGPLPVNDALAFTFDLIEGLEQVHRLGVIHRDIKPSNCFLDADGRVKVGDFGLARALQTSLRLTQTGAFVGTPLFAAPEQIKGEPLDARADVYAVCATLYYLLTGKAPHDKGDSDYLSALARVVSDDAPPVRTRRKELSSGVERVLSRGLARDRGGRFADLGQLREALEGLQPRKVGWPVLGARFGAWVVDHLIFQVMAIANFAAQGFDFEKMAQSGSQQVLSLASYGFLIVWYTVFDGLLRGTPGKWTFGLRTTRVEDDAAPGLVRGFLRAVVWVTLWSLPGLLTLFTFSYNPLAKPTEEQARTAILVMLMQNALLVAVVAAVFGTMRLGNGFRGLHEFASGTRVAPARSRSARGSYRCPPPAVDAVSPGHPEQLGAYQVKGVIRASEREQLLLGHEPVLGRDVWLWLRPEDAPEVPHARRELFRAGRMRWLAAGAHGRQCWDAFLAPRGGPVTDFVRHQGKLAAEQVQPLLLPLARELLLSSDEGMLPDRLSLEQVWLAPDGEVQLLDLPPRTEDAGSVPPLELLGQVADALMGGKADDRRPAPLPPTPLPGALATLLSSLPYFGGRERRLDVVEHRLEELGEQPMAVTRGGRLVHLALLLPLVAMCGMCPLGLGLGISVMPVVILKSGVYQADRVEAALPAGEYAALVFPGATTRLVTAAVAGRDTPERRRMRDNRAKAVQLLEAREATMVPSIRVFLDQLFTNQTKQLEQLPSSMPVQNRVQQVNYSLENEARAVGPFRNFVLGAVLVLPGLLVLSALVFRNGLRGRIVGIDVQRARGGPAGRLRCAWRAVLAVAVPLALFYAWVIVETSYWNDWTPGAPLTVPTYVVPALQLLFLGSVLGSVILAVLNPSRALHDRLAGTVLTPA